MYEQPLLPPARGVLFARRLLYISICIAGVFALASHFRDRGPRNPRGLTLERMALIEEALDRYAIDNGGLIPSTTQGLRALSQRLREAGAI